MFHSEKGGQDAKVWNLFQAQKRSYTRVIRGPILEVQTPTLHDKKALVSIANKKTT